ncbi:hypothetical protein BWQ96_04735 [Gracilariopsis chorda]|uniref:C2 NT-type domain-containing protein n=1 Tax=Gracilariopsis chorda TaxID=448386 RepID=A0A2V3ITV7_9FLOR|nr:hypothetical protein BWQ96_04735 [Gracilariopsis chorda]|eukprot:PXF45533.1 hypothetical protein BWQ96_04735 [Gracilariopsis chorda]
MKRSSSKLISKAGSVRNINKQGFKFKYEINFESVDKLTTTGDVCVTWERGPKLLATKPVRVDKQTRMAHFVGQSLVQEATLFKKKRDNAQFEPKAYKLNVRQNNERGKILAKIELNFSDYVEIPSFSKRVGASMSSGGRLIMKISSTFLGEAKVRRKSRGTASVGSSQFEYDSDVHSNSGMDDHTELDTDIADLDDLDVDGSISASLQTQPAPQPQKHIQTKPRLPATSSPAIPEVPRTQPPPQRKYSASPKLPKRDPSPFKGISYKFGSRQKSDVEVGATNGQGPTQAEFERLRQENRSLKRTNTDLLSRLDDLESRLRLADNTASEESNERLTIENQRLKKELDEVTAMLRREPVYSDVVRDLREAKMALAIITLEKDELIQALRLARR